MPIYEYLCETCGEFEVSQRITEPALQRCPTCKRKVRRLISNTSFQLKGSGWYVTDYARAGAGKDKKSAGDGGGDSAAKSESTSAKSDTAKSETKTSASA
ncbi:MAG TPA: zinc ribbon domain-containing protein [Candidatus Limnocylindria bacterium]|nr:zinc ribbon domain-containing protein [Candidatus Limnocylindria bacterium]